MKRIWLLFAVLALLCAPVLVYFGVFLYFESEVTI